MSVYSSVRVFSEEGVLLFKAEQKPLSDASGICIDTNGEVFVADYKGFIVVYDLNGKYLRTMCQGSDGDGEFTGPWAIAADGKGM